MRGGRDAIPAFAEAEADLGRALELRRDTPDALFLRGSVRTSKAVCLMDLGRKPAQDLEASGADINAGLALSSDRASGWILKGTLSIEWARWRKICGEWIVAAKTRRCPMNGGEAAPIPTVGSPK